MRPLIHGATYFRALHDALEATGPGDLVLFTDWQGDGGRAADRRARQRGGRGTVAVRTERGVVVLRAGVAIAPRPRPGSSPRRTGTSGSSWQKRGAEVLLDMRVRAGGSHHQKFVVIRHRDDPTRDVAFVGGIDLAHNRRDDASHEGDRQSQRLTDEYGAHPPWHDVQTAIQGPAVPRRRDRSSGSGWRTPRRCRGSVAPRGRQGPRVSPPRRLPCPEQRPAPPPAGDHTVQLLRTYPDLRHGRDYPFARGGERSVAHGLCQGCAAGRSVSSTSRTSTSGATTWHASSRTGCGRSRGCACVVVIPLVPDLGGINRVPQLLGRQRALARLRAVAPGRVAAYGLENRAGVPVYVHAKVCVIDDTWAGIGSDNFSRRSWTHDSELSAVVLDEAYARDLRLTLAAEHLGRLEEVGEHGLEATMADCLDAAGMYEAYARPRRGRGGRGRRRQVRAGPLRKPADAASRPASAWAAAPTSSTTRTAGSCPGEGRPGTAMLAVPAAVRPATVRRGCCPTEARGEGRRPWRRRASRGGVDWRLLPWLETGHVDQVGTAGEAAQGVDLVAEGVPLPGVVVDGLVDGVVEVFVTAMMSG